MTESQEQKDNSRPWLYKKGQSGNPGGRPIGSKSLKTYIKEKFLVMTDDEREAFLEGLDKKTVWEMAEDKPKQGTELSGNLTISEVLDSLDDGQTPKE